MKVLIGLDPGGNRSFGWCVTADSAEMPTVPIASGLANNAHAAVSAAVAAVPVDASVVAAGIDAPLFWSRRGARHADVAVRKAIRQAGAPHPAGTVQDMNSLKGACLAQGLLAAVMLRESYRGLPLTEAHPKALRWLLPASFELTAPSEHERDALLSSIAAWALFRTKDGWHDLYPEEPNPFSPIPAPVHYLVPRLSPNKSPEPTLRLGAA